MALQANRLLACKHRRTLLIYRINYYSLSSYNTSVASVGHTSGEDTIAESLYTFSTPLSSVLKDCIYGVFPVCQKWPLSPALGH